ncbi:hypothetical protein [Brucella intermedia]|uniref:hypothetical protein n=1 Tax=Brucella intermedia TaxID=94625 RepID=UPI00224B760D|nr:hypothetical protein [Brucella intermedia]
MVVGEKAVGAMQAYLRLKRYILPSGIAREALQAALPFIAPPSAARELALEEGDLNARLKAKGMYSIDEMMGSLPLDKWRVHSGMTDLKFFGEWLERKTRDYCTMHAAYEVGDKDVSDELYEWCSHTTAHSMMF